MSHSKPHHQKKPAKRAAARRTFYEVVPFTNAMPPAITPALRQHLLLGFKAVWAYIQTGGHILGRHLHHLERSARATVSSLIATAIALRPAAKRGLSQSRGAAEAIWTTGRDYSTAFNTDSRRASQAVRRHIWGRTAKTLYLATGTATILIIVVIAATLATATIALYANDLTNPSAILDKKKTGIVLLDRHGKVIYQGYGGQQTTMVPLAKLPDTLKQATLAAEDPDFYKHPGFSWKGTARAAWVDITSGSKLEGGSTLTQQLVKTALLTPAKTFQRKYQEVLLATELEQRYTKDQILEMYLNEVYYGQGAHGIQAAAQAYFRKDASQLSLSEAALLAGLPLGPSRLDPNVDPKAATDRRNYVLAQMAEHGMITADQAKTAQAEPLQATSRDLSLVAPHFVFYVLDQLRAQYGEDAVENNGMTVQTTLDLDKQTAAQQMVKDQIARLQGHNASNGGLIAITPSTGDIISMVGSIDYSAPGFGAVNVTLSNLQPGSSFKPIAYVTAFLKGWNGSTQVDDAPMTGLVNGDGTPYIPQDYDGKWRGPVTLRRALANSLNIPALKVLQYAGIDPTIAMAHSLGITTLNDRDRYGLSLVLGGGEVRPIDMATVYATFANDGVRVEPRSILKVTSREGKDITKPAATQPATVLDPKYAGMITSILSDNTARTEEFGPNSPLKLSRPAAAKTGTTNDFRDNWTVGYTPDLAAAVWVGNNDHSAMSNVDGITGAAPIWHNFMEMALAGIPVHSFSTPPGLTTASVCPRDGGLANPWDSSYTEVFPSDAPLTRHCGSFPVSGDTQPSPNQPVATLPPGKHRRFFFNY